MRDFIRAEILNPFYVTINKHANGSGDGAFDVDNNLLFTTAGCVVSFDEPIKDYAWIEVTVQAKSAAIGSTLQCVAKSLNGSLQAANNTELVQLGEFSETIFKIPNIYNLEELEFNFTSSNPADICSVRSIRVIRKSDLLIHSNAVTASRGSLNLAGFVYNANLGCYEATLNLGDAKLPPFSFVNLLDKTEYGIVRIEYIGVQSCRIHTTWNGQGIDIIGPRVEFYFNGDITQNVFPDVLNISNPNGPVSSGIRIFLEIGSFLSQDINAFGVGPQAVIPQAPYDPFGALAGSGAAVNPIAGMNGYLKAVAGAFIALASIPVSGVDFTESVVPVAGITTLNTTTINNTGTGTFGRVVATNSAYFNCPVGIGFDPIGTTSTALETRPLASLTGVTLELNAVRGSLPSTATSNGYAFRSQLTTAAAGFTLTNLTHFSAEGLAKGAGSTITNVKGFYAPSSLAVGTFNYGFYSDLNTGTGSSQLYMAGTAPSYFGGLVGILFDVSATGGFGNSILLSVGSNLVQHPSTLGSATGVIVNYQGKTTATTSLIGYTSSISTAGSAYTVTSVIHYQAKATSIGGSSTVNGVIAFYADPSVATGSLTNYAFRSDFNIATGTYQAYMGGTAVSYFGGPVGIGFDPIGTISTGLEIRPTAGLTAVTLELAVVRGNLPATATSNGYAFRSQLTTVASAFTVTNLTHFYAEGVAKGAGSTITNVRCFYASNSSVIGTNNYGFYSDIASGTNNYQLALSGTAASWINSAGGLAIGAAAFNAVTSNFLIGFSNSHTGTGTSVAVIGGSVRTPATATTLGAYYQALLLSNASAYTVTDLVGFHASTFTLGAGSTITNTKGFWASSALAVGTNNYGYYSDINRATNSWQSYMGGTGDSYFGGGVGIMLNTPVATGGLLYVGAGSATAHPSTIVNISGVFADYQVPTTATTTACGYVSKLAVPNSAFTVTDLIHFFASGTSKGASATVTNFKCFAAQSGVVASANNYGFYCNFASGTTTWAFYGAGTAASLLGGTLTVQKAIIEAEVTITYSASMTPDASAGNEQIITVTNATAMTINAPTNPATGQYLEITIRNTSGGAMGVITWNAVFKMVAFTNPATAFSRTIIFRYNGTNWIEKGRTAADIPN